MIAIDSRGDTVIRVIQKGKSTKDIVFDCHVSSAALESHRYWSTFINNSTTKPGLTARKHHVEDTGLTANAVEILLRALHLYHYQKQRRKATLKQVENKKAEQKRSEETFVEVRWGSEKSRMDSSWPNPENLGLASTSLQGSRMIYHSVDPDLLNLYFPDALFDVDVHDVWAILAMVNFDYGAVEKSPQRQPCAYGSDVKSSTVGATELRGIIHHRGKYDVDISVLRPWFLLWRAAALKKMNTQKEYEKLLYPTFCFDDKEGWVEVTKYLCCHTVVGQIHEYSPLAYESNEPWYQHLHLPTWAISKCCCPLEYLCYLSRLTLFPPFLKPRSERNEINSASK